MIIHKTGRIQGSLYMLGVPSIPVFLLDGENPVLFDAGFYFLGNLYADAIDAVLGGRIPTYCLLTHSHFDHCGAVAIFKKRYPGIRVATSARARETLAKPSAIGLIRELTRSAVDMVRRNGHLVEDDTTFEPFDVDMILAEGDSIPISSELTVQVIETPGHTRDCLSFYIPQIRLLISSEATGILDPSGYIVSDCLVDYDLYLDSMKKLARLDIDTICLGHRYTLTGEDAQHYIPRSIQSCETFRNAVETALLDEKGDIPKTISRIKAFEYDVKPEPKQPEPAYVINLEARIHAVARRMGYPV